jgi:putative protease
MPVLEDEHGTYIMNSKDLRAIQHVERLTKIGIDSLKIEGRTKSHYYVARTAQLYRQAIDDVTAGRAFNPALYGKLEGLANRGYTDGFYERHPNQDYQNYLQASSAYSSQQFVGEILRFDPALGLAEIDVKNKFAIGDRLEIIAPDGNHDLTLERMESLKGEAMTVAPGSGHQVRIPLPASAAGQNYEKALIARYTHSTQAACG